MRILFVVTYVSPTADYGGPVRVAVNQAAALQAQGHDVLIAGAAGGYEGRLPTEIEGVPARLFPAMTVIPGAGFAGTGAKGMSRWLRANIRGFDVVHVHLARDFVSLPAADRARRMGVPYVVQPHGMIDPSSNPLAVPLDFVMTRPALRAASAVLYLTPEEQRGLVAVAGDGLPLRQLGNGVPEQPEAVSPSGADHEVLFLARLAPRKRPLAFVEAAVALAGRHPSTRFALVGPDEGEGAAVSAAIARSGLGDRLVWEGPIAPEDSLERLSRSSVYVLPSVDEPFPMSVLESMSLGKPVIVTDTCGLAPLISETGSGRVVDASQHQLNAAISDVLSDPDARSAMGHAGWLTTRERLSMAAVTRALLAEYQRAAARRPASTPTAP